MRRKIGLIVCLGGVICLGIAVFTSPSRLDIATNTADKMQVEVRQRFSWFFESTTDLSCKPIHGDEGRVILRGNFEHKPLIVFCPTNSGRIFCFYDSDVLIRLIKIDTTKPFQGVSNQSSLIWIVQSSSFDVREGTKDEWKLAIDCLERMNAQTFKRQSMRGLNLSLVSMDGYKEQLLRNVRDQADRMYQLYGGETTMPLFKESQ